MGAPPSDPDRDEGNVEGAEEEAAGKRGQAAREAQGGQEGAGYVADPGAGQESVGQAAAPGAGEVEEEGTV